MVIFDYFSNAVVISMWFHDLGGTDDPERQQNLQFTSEHEQWV